jgi:hypothetical protein
MTTDFPRVPVLPEGAIGFLAPRADKGDRFALYRPDGTLSNTFGIGETAREIASRGAVRFELLPADTLVFEHDGARVMVPVYAAFRPAAIA